jgi:hypothetical protein
MAYLTQSRIQQFLETTKMEVDEINVELDRTVRDMIMGRLSARYDVTGWLDSETTPSLVLDIMSMLYAGLAYNREFSEDSDSFNGWGAYLVRTALTQADAIATGTVDLTDVIITADPTLTQPLFWPTDLQDNNFDGTHSQRRFTMGSIF